MIAPQTKMVHCAQ